MRAEVAEREGFEPSIRGYRIHDFQSCAFNRSAISPESMRCPQASRREGYPSRPVPAIVASGYRGILGGHKGWRLIQAATI